VVLDPRRRRCSHPGLVGAVVEALAEAAVTRQGIDRQTPLPKEAAAAVEVVAVGARTPSLGNPQRKLHPRVGSEEEEEVKRLVRTRTRTNTNPYDTKVTAVDRSGCARGAYTGLAVRYWGSSAPDFRIFRSNAGIPDIPECWFSGV
jgi:hypothetical protein